MRRRIAGAAASAILSLTLIGCGDRSDTAGAGEKKTMAQPLSPELRAKFEACLTQATMPPWHLVSTQPFANHLSVTIEGRSDDLDLPHRPIRTQRQQYVEIGIGRGSRSPMLSAEQQRAQISRGRIKPRGEVVGISAAAFAPFVPYARGDLTVFLNIPGREQCRYSALDADRPNPFVDCKAQLGEYTASIKFPHDAIAHLPRLFSDVRSLLTRVTSCFDQIKEQ